MSLPPLDDHAIEVDAPPSAVWAALLEWCASRFDRASVARIAWLLGCADTGASGPRPLAVGSAFAGFHVVAATPDAELRLAGRHRFADYELAFVLSPAGDGTHLTAESRADFRGIAGRAYRAVLLGTGGHVGAVRRILADIRRRATA